MDYEIRGLYEAEAVGVGIEKMRVLQMGRLDTYRRMIESSRSMAGADVTPDVGTAAKCDEGEECGENA